MLGGWYIKLCAAFEVLLSGSSMLHGFAAEDISVSDWEGGRPTDASDTLAVSRDHEMCAMRFVLSEMLASGVRTLCLDIAAGDKDIPL